MPTAGELLELLALWVPAAGLRERILARLQFRCRNCTRGLELLHSLCEPARRSNLEAFGSRRAPRGRHGAVRLAKT
jgi:hypothetical protein